MEGCVVGCSEVTVQLSALPTKPTFFQPLACLSVGRYGLFSAVRLQPTTGQSYVKRLKQMTTMPKLSSFDGPRAIDYRTLIISVRSCSHTPESGHVEPIVGPTGAGLIRMRAGEEGGGAETRPIEGHRTEAGLVRLHCDMNVMRRRTVDHLLYSGRLDAFFFLERMHHLCAFTISLNTKHHTISKDPQQRRALKSGVNCISSIIM